LKNHTRNCENTPLEFKHTQEIPVSEKPTNEELCVLFARAVYHASLPFSIVEDEHFVKFMHTVCPSFSLPTRQALSDKYLDSEHLTCDGSSDQCSESVSHMVAILQLLEAEEYHQNRIGLSLPIITRWGTHYKISKELKHIILDDGFWDSISMVVRLVEPLVTAVTKYVELYLIEF